MDQITKDLGENPKEWPPGQDPVALSLLIYTNTLRTTCEPRHLTINTWSLAVGRLPLAALVRKMVKKNGKNNNRKGDKVNTSYAGSTWFSPKINERNTSVLI